MLTEGADASQASRRRPKVLPPTHTVDVRGLPCPLPLVRLAEVVRTLAPGARVQLLGTDAALSTDLPAWCAATGHRLLSLSPSNDVLEAWVEVAPVRT